MTHRYRELKGIHRPRRTPGEPSGRWFDNCSDGSVPGGRHRAQSANPAKSRRGLAARPVTPEIAMSARRLLELMSRQLLLLLVLGLIACDAADTTRPDPPGGGQELELDFARFEAEVTQILSQRGCDNLSCHGGGIRGTYELSPSSDKDSQFDFVQTALQVDSYDPEGSLLLLKPLSQTAGGLAHAGEGPTTSFASVDDADYQTILSWILAGELH